MSFSHPSLRCCCISVLLLVSVQLAFADDSAFFESKIRPLLDAHCLQCHSVEGDSAGGLRLESQADWSRGGDTGEPVIVPGRPESSLLIQAVRGLDGTPRMPPEESGRQLSSQEIKDLETWIRNGAHDPRNTSSPKPVDTFSKRLDWWSLQPLKQQTPPPTSHPEWTQPIDRFLYHSMSSHEISPSQPADPNTLIRRLAMVLTGLPPNKNTVDAFLESWKQDPNSAYVHLVEHYLASPQYGERFARHWLDVVRFTETHGNEWNYDAPYAWRYRDYVIRAFNDDLPFDHFIKEHIAGDLLDEPRWNQLEKFNESAIGTAFYRFGEINHDSCVDLPIIGYDIVDNQVDTLTKAFQATTVACARCHDHKLDAVTTEDYHGLLALLRSSRSVMRTIDAADVNQSEKYQLTAIKNQLHQIISSLWREQIENLDASRLESAFGKIDTVENALQPSDPWYLWQQLHNSAPDQISERWTQLSEQYFQLKQETNRFNGEHFHEIDDFSSGVPANWFSDGMGLDSTGNHQGDFTVAPSGENAIGEILPAGVYTFSLSRRLNGALRSPTLQRTHSKISFQVLGNRFSLARIVFNNCQLNYNHQHSIHHDDWSWITIGFPDKTERLHPYIELLTYRDNPKFPDPLGTLGKDTENQRGPFVDHAVDPNSWWGLRKVVAHDCDELPRKEVDFLELLYNREPPNSPEVLASYYKQVAAESVDAFGRSDTNDSQVEWLNWLLDQQLLTSRIDENSAINSLVQQYRAQEQRLSLPTTMPCFAQEGSAFDQPVFARGDIDKPGSPVPPRYLVALKETAPEAYEGEFSRLDLAELIASSKNPLTARVMANRVWQWVFGVGIVTTPNDFGHLGTQPMHPELLDCIASDFIEHGWSVKHLVRQMVTSRAFRSASSPTIDAVQHDPNNALLSHWAVRRAHAEVIRDSLLAVSGRLDFKMFGPSVHPYRTSADPEKRLFTGPLDGNGRRSLYIKFQLMEAPHFLRAFNLPGGKVSEGKREESLTPAQSLAMLNDPLVHDLAKYWAKRLVGESCANPEQRIHQMYRAAFSRSPSNDERDRLIDLVQDIAREHGINDAQIVSDESVWQQVAHLIFNFPEFIYIP